MQLCVLFPSHSVAPIAIVTPGGCNLAFKMNDLLAMVLTVTNWQIPNNTRSVLTELWNLLEQRKHKPANDHMASKAVKVGTLMVLAC